MGRGVRERKDDPLSAKGECRAGYGGGQVQALGDFSPQFLVDNFNQSTLTDDKFEELVHVQCLLSHDRDPVHR